MPTKLQSASASGALGTFSQARRVLEQLAQQASRRATLQVRGPWLGFVPGVDPNLLNGTALNSLRNVLARPHDNDHGEVLGLPDAYRQVNSANLPLGDGSTIPAAPTTDGEPVVRIDEMFRFAPTNHPTNPGETGVSQWVLTGLTATAGTGAADTANLYRLSATGTWTHIARAASMTAARGLSATRDGRTPSSPGMPDSCVAPFGATARDANTVGGDNLQSGVIREPCWIYTNDVDEVMVFPAVTNAGGTGADGYEPLCDDTSSPALDAGGADGFKARSVETWNGRVYFLNTEEAGVRYNQRLRRTAKFTADPDPNLVGAGHFDFREFQGEGLRIEALGDVMAAYFTDGVAFVRPTGLATSPDEVQIVATERGLLSTHSVTPIGRNVHFGLFTDGWWLLDQSGRWQEVGLTQVGGQTVHKWRQFFYEQLDPANRHRLYTYYDQPNNRVYIVVPTRDDPEPQQVWIYDPVGDRVFMENYSVTCMGSFTPLAQAGVLINDLTDLIDTYTDTIDSWGALAGFPRGRIHGDLLGYIYQHSHEEGVVGYDSPTSPPVVQDPTWNWRMGLRSPGGTRSLSTVDRISLEYFNHNNADVVTVEVQGPTGDPTQARNALLNEGGAEALRYRDFWFRHTTHATGLQVYGTGEYHIRALELDLFLDPAEPRELGS